jgi:two-component system nitrate/nitrite response regulator NarL
VTSVAVVDDHRLFSASLAMALRAERLEVVVPGLSSLEDLRAELDEARPQVVLLDRDLGSIGSGEELIGPLSLTGSSVIVISGSLDEIVAGRCLAAGAAACIPKSEPLDVLVSTVLSVSRGEVLVSESERRRLIGVWRRWEVSRVAAGAAFAHLTPREASVLSGLTAGKSVRVIASESFVSEETVRTQVRGILTKLGVNSQLEAVVLAFRDGWRPPPGGERGDAGR